ncbi:MAG: transcription-repair coupling factor [Dehalococcoidia bacterium]|nr:transcription-repair coupling factor [Dehalococcoidia bacterium]
MSNELAGIRPIVENYLTEIAAIQGPLVLGTLDAAKPATIAALAAGREQATLVMAASPGQAALLAEELTLYTNDIPIAHLPAGDHLPYELVEDDPSHIAESNEALRQLQEAERSIVVTSWAAAAEFRVGANAAVEGAEVVNGATLSPEDLQRSLETIGYRFEALAEMPGVAARRGGILDVFPARSEEPLRIEFFGDTVASIRRIDLKTQRSIEQIKAATLPPLASHGPAAQAIARELGEQITFNGEPAEAIGQELELLGKGERSSFPRYFEPLLNRATIFDYLNKKSLLVLVERQEGAEALMMHMQHQKEARETLERRGEIPEGLPELGLQPAALTSLLDGHENQIELARFGTEELGAETLPFTTTPAFGGRIKEVVRQANQWAEEGRAVVLASQQALRLAELMEQEGVDLHLFNVLQEVPQPGEIAIVPATASGGFLLGETFALISDEEVFGLRRTRRPQRSRLGITPSILTTLQPGNSVVHIDHGIARFRGLTRRTMDGVEREYLELEYAEGDRLFVPSDQLDAVSTYVGPSDRPPTLTRLGSQDWANTKRRVQRAVAEIAQELVELYARRAVAKGDACTEDGPWQIEMEGAFPFVDTSDQLQAITDVKKDMESPRPMDRLIAGDVGYGKTEVAVRAAFKAVMAGRQVAVLVPTTVLAEQHGQTFLERMRGFPVEIGVLSRFRSSREQRDLVAQIARGDIDIAIGTHRLLQKDVSFKDLGLVVIDEEQRFGVAHKERFRQMRAEVDTLTMSATPIPRTLQMSLAGIRDTSMVATPPEERLPIRTYVTGWDNQIVREAIVREMERGGQIYFVHNRVQNIEQIAHRLRDLVPEAEIAVCHGQMPEEQLERVMVQFSTGEYDVLLCTTIIESGLDLPNVNTIIINNSNQFGLAQLYQLRGRVGRSSSRAFAFFLYDRNRAISEAARKRLAAIFEAADLGSGFQIALRDLEIRGAGNLLGAEQSGHIAAVGFELFSRLVGEAVKSLQGGIKSDLNEEAPSLPPPPHVDLPISASIPEHYIGDMATRLAIYERVSKLESPQGVAGMEEELRDRFGEPPTLVQNLLGVTLLKTSGRLAGVERISTSPSNFHLRLRNGTTQKHRKAVHDLDIPGTRVGPEQVRIPREQAGTEWMPLLVRVLRALANTG